MEHIVAEIIEILKSQKDVVERERCLHVYLGQVSCQLVAMALTLMDDALWKEHQKEGARSKRKDWRTLVTLYGEVKIRRRLVQLENGENVYPLDKFMGFIKHSRLSPYLQYIIANLAAKSVYRTTAQAVNMLTNATVSHTQVGTVLKRLGGMYRNVEEASAGKTVLPEVELKHPAVLRIEGDAVAVKDTDGKIMEIHRFQIAEGVEKHGQRHVLTGVRCAASYDHKKAVETMQEYIRQHYDLSRTLVLSNSDGGPGYSKEVFDGIIGLVGRHEHFRDKYHVNKKCKERLCFVPKDLVDEIQRTVWQQDADKLRTLLSTADGYAQDAHQEEQVDLLRRYLERNWSSLKPLSKRGVDMPLRGIGTCESNHRIYSYRMKHQGRRWSKAGAEAIASVITGRRNGDLAAALEAQIKPAGPGEEKRYKYAVRNALKKSRHQEHTAARHGGITLDCPASSAMGRLAHIAYSGGMIA